MFILLNSVREANKVAWVGGWGRTRQRTATGLESEGEVNRARTGGSINS